MTEQAGAPADRVLVIVPTYQERENIEAVVRRVLDCVDTADVLVVDDDSPDGTGKIADELAAADPRVQVLHRTAKAGLGAAYIAGFDWGLARGYGVLVEMDADGSHPPEQLPRLLAALSDADLVLGSRYVPGGAVVNWPRSREFLSRGANIYSRVLLGIPLRDMTGGYRAYRRTVLEAIDYPNVASQGYCFQVDLVWRAWRAGYRVAEVPIRFTERTAGVSKMNRAIVAEALWQVTVWGLRSGRSRATRRASPGRTASTST